MIKKTDGQNNADYSIIDTFFINKQFKTKDTFEGYQLVKYKDGDYGVLHKSIVIRPRQNEKIAYPYHNLYEKGKELQIKRTFNYLKNKQLGLSPDHTQKLRPFELRAEQKITAKVQDITKDLKSGIAELKLDAGKKKLIMKVRNEYVQNLKAGAQIAITQSGQGIKINILGMNKKRGLQR